MQPAGRKRKAGSSFWGGGRSGCEPLFRSHKKFFLAVWNKAVNLHSRSGRNAAGNVLRKGSESGAERQVLRVGFSLELFRIRLEKKIWRNGRKARIFAPRK